MLRTIFTAFSMFSAVPVPRTEWDDRNMRYVLSAFPLVGVLIGLVWWAWAALSAALDFHEIVRGAGLCLAPVLLTGGIHLDGYADTCDALASLAEPEERRRILRDPHCGAFAVIRLCTYFTAWFALCTALEPDGRSLICGGGAFVLSRALSGELIASAPLSSDTGLAHTFAASARKRRVQLILGAAAGAAAVILCLCGGLAGIAMVLAAALALLCSARTARNVFGGISGDLAGWFLQRAELWMLGALVFVRYGEKLL